MSPRPLPLAVLAVLGAGALAALTGCTTSPSPTATHTVTATATASPAPTAVTSSAPATGSSATSDPSAPAPTASSTPVARRDPNAPKSQCPDADLAVTVKYDPEGAGAGQRTSWVIFRNTGSSSCVLEGTPGVSLVGDGTGKQLGQPAQHGTGGGSTVTIPAGGYAGASLNYTYVDKNGGLFADGNGHDPTCQAARADGYRAYPPHSFRAYFVPATTYACTTTKQWISVQAVVPADKIDVKP